MRWCMMKVALVTIAHVVLIIIMELELAKPRVYMGRAQEDWSRLAGWRGKRTLTEQTMPQTEVKEQSNEPRWKQWLQNRRKQRRPGVYMGRAQEDWSRLAGWGGKRTLTEQTMPQAEVKEQRRHETLRITYQTTTQPSAKPSRGPTRLIGKPGGYYVGNQPRWKQWQRRKQRRPGQRISQMPTSPAGNHSETGMEGNENMLPEAGTLHNGSVAMGSGGTNNMEMTGGMGGYGRMMDPVSAGMMGMGSMGMGMGYGMTMGMGMGLTAMMAPAIIRQATTSLGNTATGITKAVIAAQKLHALDSKRAKRSKRKDSEDMKDSKGGNEDTDKKSTSKSGNSGTDDGKNEDSKKEDEKKKGEESENGNSTAANKEEESRTKPK
ncbi:uncharacterized protein LOC119374714 isoform X3 [Rhipicephalus sanguineus]|uniref:uncharacterized protein LOC119374714 isoform X3 n=1 Tax=Rhipicephalus sanguineus TaxID=34632 RepID=UPI0020C48EAC|nr:uncharacterized protein LOC119374714 isoform X3 [Rhipicephalus sanguineus]